ncbi:MAG: tlde1 domain-containing protein [Sphingomonadaceae bacterium]|jgi:hypothetical protein
MAEFCYHLSTGHLFYLPSVTNVPFATCYAGTGSGKNNPDMQGVSNIGPIPSGWYTIGETRDEPAPFTMVLTPDAGNNMYGRSGFLIHAENVALPGWASNGCIVIVDRTKREQIAKLKDEGVNRLQVIRGPDLD